MDNKTPEQRHNNMSRIHARDTKPEVVVRKYLFGRGLRYRKNVKSLPGTPDVVLPKYRTVVFVHGCFWHGHEGCRYAVIPETNQSFWTEKIEANRQRDIRVTGELESGGWRVLTVWTCELKRKADAVAALELLYRKIVGE